MKVVIYCQHVLGVGHFFRTLEIAGAMKSYDVILVTGGENLDVKFPDHIRQVSLPGLMMDSNFNHLHSVNPQKKVEDVKLARQKLLLDLIKKEQPDLFFIELYPFGRRGFRFELIPVLDFIVQNPRMKCKVVCSLRDILVEKKDIAKYERRVIEALNKHFDAVLVHSDPRLIRLDSTFSSLEKINIPVVYTGFVTPVPDPKKVQAFRQNAGLGLNGVLIVASVGGGNVGAPLLKLVIRAVQQLSENKNIMLNVYTGPYMDESDKAELHSFSSSRIEIEEFTHDFVSLLGAADLCVSMAGYNTCMNIVAANVPAIVWPFAQNREQRARAEEIAQFFPMTVLADEDLTLPRFALILEESLGTKKKNLKNDLDIQGAFNTTKWIEEYIKR